MKKIIASVALGALLVVGFAAVQSQPTDSAMNVEPSVLSVEKPVSFF